MEDKDFDADHEFENFLKETNTCLETNQQDPSNHVGYKKESYDRIMAALPIAMNLNDKVQSFKYSKMTMDQRFRILFQPYEKLHILSQPLFWAALKGELKNEQMYHQLCNSNGSFSKFLELQVQEDRTMLERFEAIKKK